MGGAPVLMSHASSSQAPSDAASRPETGTSSPHGPARYQQRSEVVLPVGELQRRNRSLWSTAKVSHAEALKRAAQPIGETLTVSSMCSFTATGKGGVPVAVVLDPERRHDERALARIAERCIESSVVVVQPYGTGPVGSRPGAGSPDSPVRASQRPGTQGTQGSGTSSRKRGSYAMKLFLLTPGGPSSRTMSHAMTLAAASLLLECPSPAFVPVVEGGAYAVKVRS